MQSSQYSTVVHSTVYWYTANRCTIEEIQTQQIPRETGGSIIMLHAFLLHNYKQARRLVSDFGMLTAIGTMVMISYLLRDYITVETLYVPGWKVSNSEERGWLINPLKNLNAYHIVGATIPAALVSQYNNA